MMSCHAANHTMGSLAVIPEWVVPPAQQVVDYFRISYPIVGEALSPLTGGHTAAMNWVTGGQVAPITERTEPATENLACAERILARAVAFDMPPPPVAVWTDLAVEPRESATDDREWATGVEAALGPEEAPS